MKTISKSIATLFIGSLLTFAGLNAWAGLPPDVNGKTLPSLAPMLKNVLPAIVNISVVGDIPVTPNPFSQGPQSSDEQGQGQQAPQSDGSSPRKFAALGSGVIVNAAKGYIITNAHVIRQADVITVTLKDGRQYKANVIGADPASDVAVLQINANNLIALPLAASTQNNVGDFVVAIGSPFGLSQTVTSGIISGLQRTGLGIEGYENFIQTDAPINPGNSGGALVNLHGELIGINTAILAPDGGNIGIGFAIPTSMVSSIMSQLIQYGSVHRGLMGIMVQSLTPGLADAFNISTTKGAIVAMVTPSSPASKAGFQAGDIITQIDGHVIDSSAAVTNFVGLTRVGATINVNVLRAGKPLDLKVTTASPKTYREATQNENPFFYGVNLSDFSQLTSEHGQVVGAQITGMTEDSPVAHAIPVGLRLGDVIVSANEQPVKNVGDLKRIAAEASTNHKELLLNALRGSGGLFVVLK